MIDIIDWGRKHRSMMEHWPIEQNACLPAFLLRSPSEPYQFMPNSFAVMLDDVLIGRFTYRVVASAAYVGFVLSPAYRGRRLASLSIRACCLRLAVCGVSWAYCSIALANVSSERAFKSAGFAQTILEWRLLPVDFDLALLAECPAYSYRLAAPAAMMYASMSVPLDVAMYREVSV